MTGRDRVSDPRTPSWFDRLDRRVTETMARFGVPFLRISLGLIFFWFGVLKFFPGLSPADQLASTTITTLSLGIVPGDVAVFVLAVWECAIGFGLIFGVFLRATLLLLFLQMLGTFTPLLLFPGETFTRFPYAPSLEGQYIIKNLVLIAAGIIIGATVRGGHVAPEPERAPRTLTGR